MLEGYGACLAAGNGGAERSAEGTERSGAVSRRQPGGGSRKLTEAQTNDSDLDKRRKTRAERGQTTQIISSPADWCSEPFGSEVPDPFGVFGANLEIYKSAYTPLKVMFQKLLIGIIMGKHFLLFFYNPKS